ncbi:tetratricopeptide repeat protein [Campylobacter sp. 9BO]|uniref:tetratricopeptide repeat protein n=1 Tax=Campylobacter sp. 9BO TaxID=3424759 RepID=UPI003D33A0B6
MKIKFIATLFCLIAFSGCSWQSILTFGLIKSDEEILEEKAKLELKQNEQKCADERDSVICNNVAVAHSSLKNFELAAKFYALSCDLGLATACSNLGQIYEHGLIDEKKDSQKALAYYKLGCASSDGVGCYNQAILVYAQDRQNFNQAIDLFKKSCELEYKQACVLLENLDK